MTVSSSSDWLRRLFCGLIGSSARLNLPEDDYIFTFLQGDYNKSRVTFDLRHMFVCYVLTFLGSLGSPSHSLSITNDGESLSTISELKWYTFCSYPSKVKLPSYRRPRTKAFFGRRVVYCNNSTATTQFELLKLSGDISSNPGPEKGDASHHSRSVCGGCSKTLRRNQDGVRCAGLCGKTFHVKCSGESFKEIRTRAVQAW